MKKKKKKTKDRNEKGAKVKRGDRDRQYGRSRLFEERAW